MAVVKRNLENNARLEACSFTGPEVFRYIREQLQPWGDALSDEIYRLPLEHGKVFAYLPSGFRLHTQEEFRFGKAWVEENPDMGWKLSVKFVLDYLEFATDRLAVFATYWHADDPVAAKLASPHFRVRVQHNDKRLIYCFLVSSAATCAAVQQAFSEERSYPSLTILTSVPKEFRMEPGIELSDEVAHLLAIRTRHLLIGAFENTAKLIWAAPNSEL